MRKLICLSLGMCLAFASAAQAQRVKDRIRDVRGRVVRVVPERNVVIVQTGTAPTVKEIEYVIDRETQFWGTDRQVTKDALRYSGFKQGADIWLRLGDDEKILREVRFYDPSDEMLHGKIVRVDPLKNVLVIRAANMPGSAGIEYDVDKTTTIYETPKEQVTLGLNFKGFHEGADVWYKISPRGRTITDIRFYDPVTRRP